MPGNTNIKIDNVNLSWNKKTQKKKIEYKTGFIKINVFWGFPYSYYNIFPPTKTLNIKECTCVNTF